MKTHYQVLGVGEGATAEEIRRAYRALAKALHPDAGGGAETQKRFAEAARAYEVLSDRAARRAYDRELEVKRSGAAGGAGEGSMRGGHFTWGNIAEPVKPVKIGAKTAKDSLSEFDEIYRTFFGGSER